MPKQRFAFLLLLILILIIIFQETEALQSNSNQVLPAERNWPVLSDSIVSTIEIMMYISKLYIGCLELLCSTCKTPYTYKSGKYGYFLGCRNWKPNSECAKSAVVNMSDLAAEFPLYQGPHSKPVTPVTPVKAAPVAMVLATAPNCTALQPHANGIYTFNT